MTRKNWLLIVVLLLAALIVIISGDSGEGTVHEGSGGSEPKVEQFVQADSVQINEVARIDSGTGSEFTEPGIYTVTVGLSDDGGETIVVSNSVTVIVRECIWMPTPAGGVEYVCYISNEEGREGFVTTPENVEKATLDYLKSIGY